MPRVAIVTPHMTNGDAVCNDVFGMYDVLKKRGLDTRIYAADWNMSDQSYRIWPVSKIKSFLKSLSDILIYHHSMGWRTGADLLNELKCRKVIKYHNVTPPEFFSGWSEEYEEVCREGRNQIAEIAAIDCDIYISDSEYNMAELITAGAPVSKCFVVAPFNQVERLMSIEPDFEIVDRYRDGKTTLLMVGSLFPNKGYDSLLEAFATYYYYYNQASRLVIVGKKSESLQRYFDHLNELKDSFGLDGNVVFAGQVSDEALKSYYLMADLFVTASEHEGFCVPLIESMAMRLPIIAFGSTAIVETAATAGLIWDERNPNLFAESIHTLMSDESIRAGVGRQGRTRYEDLFTNGRIEQRFLKAMGAVL
jgi:glycosyltransferase involved in cell wall biosynthesis